jgi:cytochrome c
VIGGGDLKSETIPFQGECYLCMIARCLFFDFNLLNIKDENMKALLIAATAATSLLLAGQASAADPAEALAQKSGCLACHTVAQKILGPAYKDVAAKYKGDKTAEAKLVAKVKAGGSGVWGPIPMPPNSPQVKDEDIKTLVAWVLKQ